MKLDDLRRQLVEYDPSLPRCPRKVAEHRNYAPEYMRDDDPEWSDYTITTYTPCCRPAGHEGECRNSRRVMGWPGIKTLNALIDEVEQLRRLAEEMAMEPRYDQRATPDQIDLARRLVACRRWRWLPGMSVVRWSGYYGVAATARVSVTEQDALWLAEGWLPDLTDPATLGCVLALVREAWGDPRLVAIYCEPAHPGQSEGWAVQRADNRLPVAGMDYATEAAALVAAFVVWEVMP